ncbi:hypothetical protein GJ744_012393 [Endocarpon pusillum]|uniref:Mitochondrial division protein 1 n=1 Tax=Endocarpon pusillum TaxID=364733 RepID=A0A8H7AF25_9EURO|nr:hypothetical protein GJ744_012393 [Endocarpon pusillum]
MAPRVGIDHNIAEAGATQINNVNVSTSYSNDEIDRCCLRALRCPDSLVVKNRLRENKDKLLHQSFDWILRDPQYLRWQDDDDIGLLWIKGGAGKGKTMMSIGLIEELSRRSRATTAVTYFFCQNADYELNTLEAIIKGLILQLVRQYESVRSSLRDRWDTIRERFHEDVSSWRGLWNILMEMLERCLCERVYVVVDALDECRGEGMADLLKGIVRTGLRRPSQVKWLLTSRPLDSAERELLAGSDQVRVSLELNAQHISRAVRTYISYKVAELDRRQRYGSVRRQEIEEELDRKAEDTFLWVSLVCKRLESVQRNEALTTIQELPPRLQDFYHRMLIQLCNGESSVVKGCVRLLKVMMLAYRPLHICEVSSVTDLLDDQHAIERLVDRSASFVKMRGRYVEFIHQSTRDYLAEGPGRSQLDSQDQSYHGEMAVSCLAYLSRRLKANLVELPRPDATREMAKKTMKEGENGLLASLDYAASFWFEHINVAKDNLVVQDALAEDGILEAFLRTRFLEWLECLSLLDQLPRAFEALRIMSTILIVDVSPRRYKFLPVLVQDATRFLLRHYHTLSTWPLQTYSSAIIFSPERSIVREKNLYQIPCWLTKIPRVEENWTSLLQTLVGHLGTVTAVAFSPDGRRIASGSWDTTIKVWDATTGQIEKTLAGHNDHSHSVNAVAFSPDGRRITSGSNDKTIKVWDITTGQVKKTLVGHSDWVRAVAFSPDGRRIASGSDDETIKVWNDATGQVEKTLIGHSHWVNAIAFSPDGRRITSGSHDKTIMVWDDTTGHIEKTLIGHSSWVNAVAFSPDGQRIASGSHDKTIKVWDDTTGQVEKTLIGHSSWVKAIVFSPDGQRIASGSNDETIKVWDDATGQVEKTLIGHSSWVITIAFSPDGQRITSGSGDKTVKIWDYTTGQVEKTLVGHSHWVIAIAFSPDGRRIASGSLDKTIKIWDTTTGQIEKTLVGHSAVVCTVAFSPDGRRIASGSDDGIIKVQDIKRSLNSSNRFRSTLSRHLKYGICQEIQTSGPVLKLCFSTNGIYLVTNLGSFKLGETGAERQSQDVESSLYINDQWVQYGSTPVLRLPAGFEVLAYDVKGDQLAVGLRDGRVFTLSIDCKKLVSTLNL